MMFSSQNKNNQGFSLLEVLVAVAILGIALLAVVYATQQASRSTRALQNKFSADLLAADLLARIQTNVMPPPGTGGTQNGESVVWNHSFQWIIRSESMSPLPTTRITVIILQQKAELMTLQIYQPAAIPVFKV